MAEEKEHEKKDPPKEHHVKHHKKEHKKTHHKKHKKKTKLVQSIAVIAIIVIIAVIIAINYSKLTVKEENAALVNGDAISMQTLDKEYELFFQLTGYPEQYRDVITKEKFLEQVIIEKLLLQEAKKQDMLKVSKSEVDSALNIYLSKLPFSQEDFESNLNEVNLTLDDVRNYFKKQVALINFLNKTILEEIEVTDEEVDLFYSENKNLFEAQEGQVRAAHILVETKKEAEDILEQLEDGADFAQLAVENSIDPSAAQNSGDLGFFGKGQMVQEFEEAAFALGVNELSDPVNTSFGYHIIKRLPDKIELDEVKDQIKQNLFATKQQEVIKTYIDELKEESEIEVYVEETQTETIETPQTTTLGNPTTESTPLDSDCIEKYDLAPETVVFYHADWCGYCQKMKPVVEELQEEDYTFLWSETSGGENMEVVNECLSNSVQGSVPEFICAGTGEVIVGAVPKESLKEFADKCKS